MKVAINGFGRLGRAVFRTLQERTDLELTAINAPLDAEALAYLARRDSVHGAFPGRCELVDGCLVTARGPILLTTVADGRDLPWRALGVDLVVEGSDQLCGRAELERHLAAGVRRVVVAGAAQEAADATIIIGVNESSLRPGQAILSAGSGAANCLAVLVSVLDRAFGLEHGLATVTGGGAGDQCLVDAPHDDPRRGRAAHLNIVPTASGAAQVVGRVLPHLVDRLDSLALRVPGASGSLVELVSVLRTGTTAGAVNEVLRLASEEDGRAPVLGLAEDPLVSTDVIGDGRSCIFDPGCTRVVAGRTVRTLGWFDAEWGLAARVCDLLERLEKSG